MDMYDNLTDQETPACFKKIWTFFSSQALSAQRAWLRWLAAFFLAAMPGVYQVAHAQGLSQITALGQSYSAAKPVATSLSRLTFYRPENDGAAKAVSIYIDGAYHASLTPNGYAEVCLKPGETEIGLRRVEGATDVRNPIQLTQVRLLNGEQQFLRISDQPGQQPMALKVPPVQARAELAPSRLQIHTLSRAPRVVPCEDAPVVAVMPVVAPVVVAPAVVPAAPQVISLASDALFPFGKSALNDMLLNGRLALDAVVNRVKTEYASVGSIKVVGHSDPIGRPQDKQLISAQRAQTVSDYLRSNGLSSTRILNEGRADTELALSGCGSLQSPPNIQCNAPNRRVAIEISGTRR